MSEGLPKGWAWATVAELAPTEEQPVLTGPFGSKLKTDDFKNEGIPVITIGCLTDTGLDPSKANYISPQQVADFQRYLLRQGDILFSRMASVGRASIVPDDFDGSIFNYHLMRLRLHEQLYLPWLFVHYVRGAKEVRSYLDEMNHGATRDGVNTQQLVAMPVKVPPLNEQRRIVAKLDALQARSRRARQALDAIPALLDRFRQSVLAAAFRGDLTAEWRAAHPDVEPASVLLQRIRAERKARWVAAEVDKARAKAQAKEGGTWGPKEEAKARVKAEEKYEEPEAVDTEGLPALPKGWCWARFEELAENYDGRRIPITSKDRVAGPFPYYGASGIIDHVHEFIFEGDYLLIAEDGANLLARQTPIAFKAKGQFWVNNHAHVVQPRGGICLDYLMHVVESLDVRPVVTGSAQPKLTQAALNRLLIPLCTTEEQKVIAGELQKAGTLSESVGIGINQSTTRLDTLDQAILAKAFRGELVPQDPNDEPASALLQRIAAERDHASPKKATRARKAKDTP